MNFPTDHTARCIILLLVTAVGCNGTASEIPGPGGAASETTIVLENGKTVPVIARGQATEQDIVAFCSGCHALPSPDSFPRHVWPKEVGNGYFFFRHDDRTDLPVPHYTDVLKWYQDRAPAALNFASMPTTDSLTEDSGFERVELEWNGSEPLVAVASMAVVGAGEARELVFCDMATGAIWQGSLATFPREPVEIGRLQNPCRIVVTDLDLDGSEDLLITDLGSFKPADHQNGTLWWFRRDDRQSSWSRHLLCDGLSRPCDVQAADCDQDGDLDLLIAEFGWHMTGKIVLLTNTPADGIPRFEKTVVDGRHGAVQLPVTDLNDDGWPDLVALLSQHHELLEGLLNDTQGGWKKVRLGQTDNPSWGATGATIIDLDGDGDDDIVTSNGDTMDAGQATPTQGISWWENTGETPYSQHELTIMPGCYAAVPGDLDGDSDLDLAAVSYLPLQVLTSYPQGTFDSVVWLEQTETGIFRRHFLEEDLCNHVTCLLVDWDGDGSLDILTGPCDFDGRPSHVGLTLFRSTRGRSGADSATGNAPPAEATQPN